MNQLKVTREYIEKLIQPGDFIVISYLRPNFVQAAIGKLGDGWMHAARCREGFRLVEADVPGVFKTDLRQYLKGNCRLLLRRAKPARSAPECRRIVEAAEKMVGEGYDFGTDVAVGFFLLIRNFIHPWYPRLGNWLLKNFPNFLASKRRTMCSELVVLTERAAWDFMWEWSANKVIPADLASTRDAYTVADLRAPVLVRKI